MIRVPVSLTIEAFDLGMLKALVSGKIDEVERQIRVFPAMSAESSALRDEFLVGLRACLARLEAESLPKLPKVAR